MPAPDFATFYRTEFSAVARHVMLCGACEAEAWDATQHAFEQAFPTWDTLRHPRAWLQTVARRAFYRSPARDRREMLAADPYASNAAEPSTAGPSLSVAVEYDQLLSAVQDLPPKQREAMALAIDGWRAVDIADHLGVAPGAVRENLRKARLNLMKSVGMRRGEANE